MDDKIVTTFCEGVTGRDRQFVTTELGEAMAPASGSKRFGAGAPPIFLILLVACGDDGRVAAHEPPVATHRAAADPATGITTDLDGAAPQFSSAVVAELTGDEASARKGFDQVLAASDAPPSVAARAAIHLAQLEARAGRNRHALDLVARAAALAPGDVAVAEGIAQLRGDIVAASSTGDLRGPPVGTVLLGVDPKVAEAFAEAERGLVRVHALQPRIYIESLSSAIRAKEDATETIVAKYRAVADAGGLAQVAADYRIGSLYQDLALGLLFEPLPPELADPNVAAGLRRTLRGRALVYLKRAVTSYRASLAGPQLPDAELWRLAADTDLHGAVAILGEAGDVISSP